ncbi:phosphatidylinositol-specific phospholipase C domain-containing protein [Ruminococcus sp.]|uniref:phosphatidylinositol-specific phospholipase C domain-containing protein n=1 Tax=Ruminococcus sp. TaxID=41978 RepID=UPI003862FFDC
MKQLRKSIMKAVSMLLSFVMIVSIFTVIPNVEKAQAAQTPSKLTAYPGYDNLNSHWDKEWMSYIPDDAKLNELSIPGIHDACAVDMDYSTWMGHFVRTQDYYYMEQMANGVRYFDLRIGKDDGKLTLCHGSIYLNGMGGERLRLDEVIRGMLRFLSFHESETMIIQIKCDKDKCDQDIYKYFQYLLAEQPDKIYCGDHAPTLGEARGKLVILSRLKLTESEDELYQNAVYQPNYLLDDGTYWALDVSSFEGGDEYNRTMAKTTDFDTVEVWTEDVYNIKPDGKWKYIESSLMSDYNAAFRKNDARSKGKDAWSIIYTSLSYQDSDVLIAGFLAAIIGGAALGGFLGALAGSGIVYLIEDNNDMVWPDDGAAKINPALYRLLREYPDLYTGCLETDFMDYELARLIYSTNFNRRNQDPWNRTYRVTFDSTGGSSVKSQDILPGGYVSAPEPPVREGYSFSGWYTKPEATRYDYWYFDYDPVYSNMTLYAKWDESSVPYVDANGSSMPPEEAEGIFDDSLEGLFTLSESGASGGWYAAQKDFGGDRTGLVIDGDVNLILCDGVTLKLYDGIKVPQGSSLTIWAQSTDAMTRGSLEVFKNYSDAAIGTSLTEPGGSVIINGGTVGVTGNAGAASIGGMDTNITVNGGSVRANSSSMSDLHLPAIGGSGGSVTITGGVVSAYSDEYAPAIGSVGENSTKVVISGGRVNAYGGLRESPAIGAGSTAAGQPTADADVTITGGRVNATARSYSDEKSGWAIGGQSGTVTITGGNVIASADYSATPYAGIGGENCTVDLSWTNADDSITSCSYDGNLVLHEDKPFRYKDEAGAVSAQDIISSQNKTIVPKTAVGTLTKTDELAPTCMSYGYKAYWTDEEGNLFADEKGTRQIEEPEIIPALGHDWGEPVYTWENDYDIPDIETHHYMCSAIRTCKRDDAHTESEYVIAAETIVTEAGCTTPGVKELKADFDKDWAEDQTIQIELPALGHDWGEWTVTKEATLTEEGEETRVCRNDASHIETRAIPKIDENATFTITFADEDGTILQSSELRYDETPVFSGELPLKDGFTFVGWTDGENTYAADKLPAVKKAAAYTAVFLRYSALVEPRIDENGDYILGQVAYYEVNDKKYAVNEDGGVGEELESVELSYFDFKLINNGAAYQINYYTGPTQDLKELVIPKTFNGKPITVLGNDDITETNNSKLFRNGNRDLHPFVLRLNENITEIKPYTFWAIWVTKVTGDTDNLGTIGKYAFSWANSTGGYALDIQLDYEGKIKCGAGIFNNMNVTARIKHATGFDRSSFSQKSMTYSFTDAHTYGEPKWTWADDHRSATATFTCTDSRCKHQETVDANVTSEKQTGKITYTATTEMNGRTYTDTKETDREYFVGHSLSLNGDIGVNFYLDLTDREIADGAKVDFAWTVNGKEKTSSITLSADDKYACGYKATCNVAVAEMTYDVTATLSIGGEVIKTDTYSVKNYADTILTSDDFRTKYIAEKGEEKYDQLVTLVKTMLDYGSKAQLTFDRNTDALANGGTDYFTDTVNASDIASTMSNMTENLSSYGLEYTGTTIVYLTETSIRHYYTITDQDTFDLVKDNITFDGVKVGYTKKGNEIYFEKKGVAAADLDVAYTFSIGTNSYDYAVLDYVKRCLESDKVKPETKELVAATYRYNQAANTYFGR